MGALLLVGQALSTVPVVPGPLASAGVALGLLPAVAAVGLPVALLFGAAATGQQWRESGELLALAAGGQGARRLLLTLVLVGVALGGVEASLTHGLEPRGRAEVRRHFEAASAELRLRAGQPAELAGALLRAGGVEGRVLRDVFLASGDLLVSAASGEVVAGGLLELKDGEALRLEGAEAAWRLGFERARVPVVGGARRVELAERSTAELIALVEKMGLAGRPTGPERLALYKRTALPLAAPLLGLLGFALGARGLRPAVAATVVALGWWAVLRLCDHGVAALGPAVCAALPPVLLLVVTMTTWLGWRAR